MLVCLIIKRFLLWIAVLVVLIKLLMQENAFLLFIRREFNIFGEKSVSSEIQSWKCLANMHFIPSKICKIRTQAFKNEKLFKIAPLSPPYHLFHFCSILIFPSDLCSPKKTYFQFNLCEIFHFFNIKFSQP